MQQKLLDVEDAHHVEAGLLDARQRLKALIRSFNLTEGDLSFIDATLDTYAEHPTSGPEAFGRQIASYIKNCILQTRVRDKKMKPETFLKRFNGPLDLAKKAALQYAKLVVGEDDLNDTGDVMQIGERIAGKKNVNGRRANDLDGATWLRYSVSVWNDISKTQEEYSYGHPAMFPSELPDRLIRMFTTGDYQHTILDPFMGSGSTLVAAVNNGKKGIGFEIYDEFIQLAEVRLTGGLNFSGEEREFRIIKDDARFLDKHLSPETVDLCITSPPYWDILSQKRSADYKETRNYGGPRA